MLCITSSCFDDVSSIHPEFLFTISLYCMYLSPVLIPSSLLQPPSSAMTYLPVLCLSPSFSHYAAVQQQPNRRFSLSLPVPVRLSVRPFLHLFAMGVGWEMGERVV